MRNLNRLKFVTLTIVSLCLTLIITTSPSVANRSRPSQPRDITFRAPRPLPSAPPTQTYPSQPYQQQPFQQQPFQQPIQKIPGTAGCMMTRSDGSTVNLDRICGSNVNLPTTNDPNVFAPMN